MEVHFGKKKVKLKARRLGFFGKFSGLMFRSRNTENLLFDHAGAIHSWFVFFPFLAVWLNRDKIVGVDVVKPFTTLIRPKKGSNKLVEIPINEANKQIVKLLVGKKL